MKKDLSTRIVAAAATLAAVAVAVYAFAAPFTE